VDASGQAATAAAGLAPGRRAASLDEAKAIASPLRLRILRLCFDESLTNEQLAARLDRDPATVLHHVRTLVRTGFLEPAEPRPGPRGSTERPYRATGKSWTVEVTDPQYEAAATHALVDAFAAEARESDGADFTHVTRAALRLTRERMDELGLRLQEIIAEYVDAPPDPDGEPWAVFVALHRRHPTGG
jgi:predicted ArsR family transcriptional regulator